MGVIAAGLTGHAGAQGGGAGIYLFDRGGGDAAKIKHYAEEIHASHESTVGKGEFPGKGDSCDAAREEFARIIRAFAESGDQDHQRIAERFGRIRDRWFTADYIKRWQGGLKYNPDQPRDEFGRWAPDGGGGTGGGGEQHIGEGDQHGSR